MQDLQPLPKELIKPMRIVQLMKTMDREAQMVLDADEIVAWLDEAADASQQNNDAELLTLLADRLLTAGESVTTLMEARGYRIMTRDTNTMMRLLDPRLSITFSLNERVFNLLDWSIRCLALELQTQAEKLEEYNR